MKRPFRIWQDVYAIGGSELTDPYDCCVYLLGGPQSVVIDCGAGASFNQLVANIREVGFDPEKVAAVIATHAHIDHIGALYQFRSKFGARIVAHELDATAIESGQGVGADLYGVDYEPCPVDIKLKASEENFTWSGGQIKILHIPGHTPGGIAAYVDLGKRILFGQDIHGPYFVRFGANQEQAAVSLQKLVDLQSDILCEGHFGIYQPASQVENYIKMYLNGLRRGDMEEDFQGVY